MAHIAYSHTVNGEWSSKIVSGKTTAYEYDVFGNLRATVLPDGTKIEYVIDGVNRRIGKKVNSKLIQIFLYHDQLKPVAELDGQNTVVSRFIYASTINVPDYMEKGGKTYRIITDHLDSPRLVIDVATGMIAQRMDYDEFGNVLQDTSPGFQPFGGDDAVGFLYRRGLSWESPTRLARKAAEAEAKLGIHGVSVSARAEAGTSRATRQAIAEHFPIHQTGSDPMHYTVELPQPVTQQVAELFNTIFGRTRR